MHLDTIDTSQIDENNGEEPITATKINKIASLSYEEQYLDEGQDLIGEEELVKPEEVLVSDRQGINETNTLLRVFSALAIAASLGVAVIFMVSFWGKVSGGNSVSENNVEEELAEPVAEENELGNAKAELAISEQESDLQPQLKFEPEPQKEVENQPEPKAQSVKEDSPVSTANPVVKAEPQELEPTNPLDEWARLATLGVSTGDRELAVANLNEPDSNLEPVMGAETVTHKPQLKNNVDNSLKEKVEIKDTIASGNLERNRQDNKSENSLEREIDNREIVKVASVSIGNLGLEAESNSGRFDAQSPAVQKLLGDRQSEDSYLKRKARQYEEQDRRLAALTDMGVASSQTQKQIQNINSDKSEQIGELASLKLSSSLNVGNEDFTYIKRKAKQYEEEDRQAQLAVLKAVARKQEVKSNFTAQNASYVEQNSLESRTKKVPLGTVSTGEIATTIIWSEGLGSSNARGKINLSEPILADDGSVALEANSSLIVEVQGIASNGLSLLNVIAVSYESNGQLKQELIPPGAILINGEENEPLIAEKTNDSGGTFLGQDVLIGLLGAGERGFEAINEPNDNTTISNDLIVRTSSDNDVSLINGAAEGAFATTKERLEDRSERILDEELERMPIYHLEEGKTVSIFINSFLEIDR